MSQIKWIALKQAAHQRSLIDSETCKSYITLIGDWLIKAEELRENNTLASEAGLETTEQSLNLTEVC